jgi:polar amino acid transport system ATP-binding protein
MEAGVVIEEGPPAKIFGPDASPRARAFIAEIAH